MTFWPTQYKAEHKILERQLLLPRGTCWLMATGKGWAPDTWRLKLAIPAGAGCTWAEGPRASLRADSQPVAPRPGATAVWRSPCPGSLGFQTRHVSLLGQGGLFHGTKPRLVYN